MRAVDEINALLGRDTVRYAAAGFRQGWQARCGRRSPRYTTCWRELLTIFDTPRTSPAGCDVEHMAARGESD
jgi:hypothetical protein